MMDEYSYQGKDCKLSEEAEIIESTLKDEVVVGKGTRVIHSQLGKKVQLENNNTIMYATLGNYCYTGPNTNIRNAELGSFNSISWNVSIGGNTHDLNKVTTHSFIVYPKWGMGANSNWESVKEPCIIENDVWIAAGVNILRGVTVGSGAVIGAGAVVTKDVPPYSVVVGNPGRVIRMRYSDEIIERMLQLKWWELPTEVIKAHLSLFQSELTMTVIDELFAIKESL